MAEEANTPRMSIESAAKKLVARFRSRPTLRAGSLITTVFGDAIAPRGGIVWIGSLIQVMADFGISERLVRTSVFRLAADGWLEAHPVGRRSYYGLTDVGRARFEQATQRIYGAPKRAWSGEWCVVLVAGVPSALRDELRRELAWLGFGAIGSNLLAHPSPDHAQLEHVLAELGLADDAIVITGRSAGPLQDSTLRELAKKSWDLDGIAERYREFVTAFSPAAKAAEKGGPVVAQTAFQLRTLMIQDYRKILLRDPLLPVDLLPEPWPGHAAYDLCRMLYRRIYAAADRHLGESMETIDGPLPAPTPEFFTRFGGLDSRSR